MIGSSRGFRLSPERRKVNPLILSLSKDRINQAIVRHRSTEMLPQQKQDLSGYYPVFPCRPLDPQALGELLADLGDLGADDDLTVHAGRVVRVELPVLGLCLVERLEFGDLGDHGAG